MSEFKSGADLRGGRAWDVLPGWALVAALLFSFISISLAQIFFYLAVVLWIIRLILRKESPAFPRFLIPLIIFTGWSILSAAFSVNPEVSFLASRELTLFLMVPLAYMVLDGENWKRRALTAIFISAAASLVYSYYHVASGLQPDERVKGFMGHYMTQAGLLLLFCAVALGFFVFYRKRSRFLWGAAFLVGCPALALTLTRSAWIGLGVAACVILGLYKPKLLALVPVAAVLAYLGSPAEVKRRVESIFTTRGTSNEVRIEYARAGLKIIKQYPIFGTGLDTVDMEFQLPKYGLSAEARNNVHLHNNILQIAAERGIPALLAWLAFFALAVVDLRRIARSRDPADEHIKPAAAGALAAAAALFVAGFFEYNFADSEITLLFLFLITLPFAQTAGSRTKQNI